jgi:hypothetical protein
MDPIFDLIVIGVIVSMVLLNLYLSKDASHPKVSFWSSIWQKLNAFNPLGHKKAFGPYGSAHIPQD